jgi:hypothetical protein
MTASERRMAAAGLTNRQTPVLADSENHGGVHGVNGGLFGRRCPEGLMPPLVTTTGGRP